MLLEDEENCDGAGDGADADNSAKADGDTDTGSDADNADVSDGEAQDTGKDGDR